MTGKVVLRMAQVAMLIDLSKCMGCRACQVACKEWNDLEAETTKNRGTYENPPDLSPNTWTRIRFQEDVENGEVRWRFFKEQCLHCTNAPCVAVCPTGALKNHAMGFVSYEEELCNGCAYCANFCPFGIPRMKVVNRLTGEAKATKCTLCQDRVTNGYIPVCAKTCPADAISFGDRETILAKGRKRVEKLRAGGSRRFPDANLYGADVLGGLGVMYVLPEKPEKYGLPTNPESALTVVSAWKEIIQPLGQLALGVGVVSIALNWVVTRRRVTEEQEA